MSCHDFDICKILVSETKVQVYYQSSTMAGSSTTSANPLAGLDTQCSLPDFIAQSQYSWMLVKFIQIVDFDAIIFRNPSEALLFSLSCNTPFHCHCHCRNNCGHHHAHTTEKRCQNGCIVQPSNSCQLLPGIQLPTIGQSRVARRGIIFGWTVGL
jgi:hypothetical protein